MKATLLFWTAIWYATVSLLAWILFWRDKLAASRGGWRVKESTLLFLTLIGGWPGALAAQQIFRHKTRKTQFQVLTWLAVAVNVGLFAAGVIALRN